jgi:hypothetical protein
MPSSSLLQMLAEEITQRQMSPLRYKIQRLDPLREIVRKRALRSPLLRRSQRAFRSRVPDNPAVHAGVAADGDVADEAASRPSLKHSLPRR